MDSKLQTVTAPRIELLQDIPGEDRKYMFHELNREIRLEQKKESGILRVIVDGHSWRNGLDWSNPTDGSTSRPKHKHRHYISRCAFVSSSTNADSEGAGRKGRLSSHRGLCSSLSGLRRC